MSKISLDYMKELIEELSESKNNVHLVFMSTEFNSAAYKKYIDAKETRPRMKSVPTQPSGRKGIRFT